MRGSLLTVALVIFSSPAWPQNSLFLEGPGFSAKGPSADLYGFVMADAGYNAGRIDPDWNNVIRPSKLPSGADEFGEDGSTWFSVRQTRFGIKAWQPTAKEDIRGIFEFELFGTGVDAGQTTFRLRHAYLQYGKFGAGQYWSAFMDIDIFPNSVEYWGPNGMVFFRNRQIRYMPVMGENHHVTISLEEPGASGDAGEYDEFLASRNGLSARFPVPDLAANYRYTNDWGYVQAAGIVRRIQWDDTTNDAIDVSGSKTGWGINLTTNVKLGPGTLKGGIVFGDGIENYFNDGGPDIAVLPNPIDPNNPALPPGGAMTVPAVGLSLFYDVEWNERLSSTFGFSSQDLDLDGSASLPATFQKGQYALANLTYYPVKELMTSVELQYGRRENFSDGWDYDAWRVQFTAKYRFSFKLGEKP